MSVKSVRPTILSSSVKKAATSFMPAKAGLSWIVPEVSFITARIFSFVPGLIGTMVIRLAIVPGGMGILPSCSNHANTTPKPTRPFGQCSETNADGSTPPLPFQSSRNSPLALYSPLDTLPSLNV